jgi:hypothetical protein
MVVTSAWDNPEQTIQRYEVGGEWTWDDFAQARELADAAIDATPHQGPIAILIVRWGGDYFPPNVITLARRSLTDRHPRVSVLIYVSDTLLSKLMFGTLLRMYPEMGNVWSRADSLEEARTMARSRLATANSPFPGKLDS